MTDVLTQEQRRRCMSHNRDRDTKPEMLLRRALWARGCRYRLRCRLPGRPDIIFVSARVAVFVDGCFWHGCPIHATRPKVNEQFWARKLQANSERDRAVNDQLGALGWTVLRVWEHEVRRDAGAAAARIETAVRPGHAPRRNGFRYD